MRAFFFLLLLTNILFLLVQWLYPYEQWASQPRPLAAAERLRLIGEAEQSTRPTELGGNGGPTATASEPPRLCYTLGPFKDAAEAQEAAQRLRDAGVDVSLRPSQEQEYMGVMVYLGPHDSRRQARELARELGDKGVRDYIIFSEPDKMNSLSLGVFGRKANAERRIAELEKLGYQPRSEMRYRQRTIYWLDYGRVEPDSLRDWIAQLKSRRGISRITRQCDASTAPVD